MGKINITSSQFKQLKIDYRKAVKDNKTIMYSQGTKLPVEYVKYFIKYNENKFKIINK